MIRRLFALFALAASAGAQAQAQARAQAHSPLMSSVDTALLRGMTYRLVGHSRGGRVTTVTGTGPP